MQRAAAATDWYKLICALLENATNDRRAKRKGSALNQDQDDAEREFQVTYIIERHRAVRPYAQERVRALAKLLRKN